MDDVESIEDICASLGLGHVPMLNEENRELNKKLQDLQVQSVPKMVLELCDFFTIKSWPFSMKNCL